MIFGWYFRGFGLLEFGFDTIDLERMGNLGYWYGLVL